METQAGFFLFILLILKLYIRYGTTTYNIFARTLPYSFSSRREGRWESSCKYVVCCGTISDIHFFIMEKFLLTPTFGTVFCFIKTF